MKPLIVLARILFVGCLWSIIFTEGIRVIMLENWRFDIFWSLHWVYAWNLWSAGWVIDTPKEWAFVLIIISFVPLWLTGWIALCMISWENIVLKLVMFPVNLFKRDTITIKSNITKTPVVVKKKSYKEIRPTGRKTPIRDYTDEGQKPAPAPTPISMPRGMPASSYTPTSSVSSSGGGLKDRVVNARETFSHSLFNLDNEDDDFDLDFDAFEKSDIFKSDNKKQKKKGEQREVISAYDEDDDSMFHNALAKSPKKQYDEENSRGQRRNDERREEKRDRKERDQRNDERKSNNREDKNDYRDRKDNRKDSRRNEYASERSEKPQREVPQTQEKPRGNNPIVEVLTQKGYDIIAGVTIKNIAIDFMAVSENTICLCFVDKETGDWLADEERFNNEEPLWFSENSHRISPVRKVSLAKEALQSKIEDSELNVEIKPFVIIQMGNIINAEDMFEVWEEANVEVTRINRGSPKEIKLFSKTVEEADARMDRADLEVLKKIIRSVG